MESERKKVKNGLLLEKENVKDLDYILKSVRGLVTIIHEIWENCKEHCVGNMEEKDNFTNEGVTMKRVLYEKVAVKASKDYLEINSANEFSIYDFGRPPSVPKCLTDLIVLEPNKNGDIIPDYDKYISKSMILCKEILLPFLTGLLEHLQEVQVYIGKIEAWLLEPKARVDFLNELFEKKVAEIEPMNTDYFRNRVDQKKNPVCIRCLEPFLCHRNYHTKINGNKKHHISRPNQGQHRLKCKDGTLASFYDAPSTFLYESYFENGDMNLEFKLSNDEDKQKMKAFFSFLKICK